MPRTPLRKDAGPNTARWLQLGQNARLAMFNFMRDMDAKVETVATAATNRFIASVREKWDASITAVYIQTKNRLEALPGLLSREMRIELRKKIDSLPHIKGDPGYTPVKGKDYFDGEPGPAGTTPRAGLDYATIEQTKKMIGEEVAYIFGDVSKGATPGQMRRNIKALLKELTPEKIARAIEKLPEIKKLDYTTGLKNQPSTIEGGHQKVLHRGGSSVAGRQTYSYDLSDQCNGVLKSFTIPTNTRVLGVFGTDVPSGVYRPVVDWTGTGTTTLTLTSAVAAPSEGATLYILYVV